MVSGQSPGIATWGLASKLLHFVRLNVIENVTPKEIQAPFLICLSSNKTLFLGTFSLLATKRH